MGLLSTAALGAGILLPFIFLLYVDYRTEHYSQVTIPWLRDWAEQESKGWRFGLLTAFFFDLAFVSIYMIQGIA